jgi:hypothetical protein
VIGYADFFKEYQLEDPVVLQKPHSVSRKYTVIDVKVTVSNGEEGYVIVPKIPHSNIPLNFELMLLFVSTPLTRTLNITFEEVPQNEAIEWHSFVFHNDEKQQPSNSAFDWAPCHFFTFALQPEPSLTQPARGVILLHRHAFGEHLSALNINLLCTSPSNIDSLGFVDHDHHSHSELSSFFNVECSHFLFLCRMFGKC